jgi:phosphate transport system substrate-binding protein
MALQYGKCINYELCTKADKRETQAIPEGVDLFCEECKRPLAPLGIGSGGGGKSGSNLALIAVALLGLGLLFAGGAFLFLRLRSPTSEGSPSAAPSVASASKGSVLLRLSGSNTIGAKLGPDLVEAWLRSKGATNTRRAVSAKDETAVIGTLNGSEVSVLVKAHGSATGFADLGSNSCDIAMSSRKIKAEEANDLGQKGLGNLTSNAGERVLGLDGVAIVVNEANTIDTVTEEDLAGILSGDSKSQSWNVYARDDKSGTYETVKDRVLTGDRVLTPSAKRFEDSRELADAVARDPNGIGIVGLPYADGDKALAVSERGARPLIPNTMTIRTEAYPLSRRLFLYVPDNAKPEAREFVHFALSKQGQDVVDGDGFVGQKVDVFKEQAPANAPQGYLALLPSAARLSVDFRFRTGSSELDTKAVDDIKRVSEAMSAQFAGRGVMLVGFADSTGNPGANLKLSKERAQAVAAQMQRQGIAPVSVIGFGQELPVADNSTPEGREKNRRVEIWLRK